MSDTTIPTGWYVAREHEMVGPISDAELRDRAGRGMLGRDDYAWRDGMELWVQLKELPGVASVVRQVHVPVSEAGRQYPSRPPVMPTQKSTRDSVSQQRRNEATSRAAKSAGPASEPAKPEASSDRWGKQTWSAPSWPANNSQEAVTKAAKDALGKFSKLPPLAIGLLALGIFVPQLLIPAWLGAFIVWLRQGK